MFLDYNNSANDYLFQKNNAKLFSKPYSKGKWFCFDIVKEHPSA